MVGCEPDCRDKAEKYDADADEVEYSAAWSMLLKLALWLIGENDNPTLLEEDEEYSGY